jgi:hypothetical protein
MMQIETRVTQVRELAYVRRQRRLARAGETFVVAGQEVSPIQVVARSRTPAGVFVLNAAEVLAVPSEEVEQYLLVSTGASLQEGTPLLRRPSRFGRTKLFRSPTEGVLRQVRHGYLVLQLGGVVEELRAMMEGRVAAVIPSRGVILETSGTLIQALWDSGSEGFGVLRMAANTPDYELDADRIAAGAGNAILVTGRVSQPQVLFRLEEIGARGLIVGGMPAELCKTASEVSYPVAITDSVGGFSMAEPIFELLQRSEGRQASILIADQEAHGQRTEIVIPLAASSSRGRGQRPQGNLEVGSLVRVLRARRPALLGEVTRLYPEAKKLSGSIALYGARVRLKSGRHIHVPASNLDLIVQ